MQLLVTGGAGFIGSHVVERALERGHAVRVLDDLSTGQRAHLAAVANHPRLELAIGSAADEDLVVRLAQGCDAVLHLAASVGVRMIVDRPVHTITNNLRATESVLRAAVNARARVLLASSSEVYGKSAAVPFAESQDVQLGPTSCARWAYGGAKAMDEWLGFAMMAEHGVPVTALRFFNTVGPRQTGAYGMVMPNFVRAALAGEPLPVYGDGRQTRSFALVTEVADAVLDLLSCEAAAGQAVNVGSAEEVAIEDLARRVLARTGRPEALQRVPYADAYARGFEDLRRRVPDLALLRRLIGWVPSASLDQIIDAVIAEAAPGVSELATSRQRTASA